MKCSRGRTLRFLANVDPIDVVCWAGVGCDVVKAVGVEGTA